LAGIAANAGKIGKMAAATQAAMAKLLELIGGISPSLPIGEIENLKR
jgi:hypothetical protein